MDVFDLTGRLVKTVSAARTRQEMIDLSSLKPGIYFIKSNASNRLSRITLLR
jgi:hypothetical protein